MLSLKIKKGININIGIIFYSDLKSVVAPVTLLNNSTFGLKEKQSDLQCNESIIN